MNIYLIIGYVFLFAGSLDAFSVIVSKGVVALMQFFPMLLLILFWLNEKFFIVRKQYIVLYLTVFYFLISSLKQADVTSVLVLFRNMEGAFFFYLLGEYVSKGRFSFPKWIELLLLVFLVEIFFTVIDLYGGVFYWQWMFPSEFIAAVKSSGTALGIMGNKISLLNGQLLYRLSGTLFEPHHLGHLSVIFIFLGLLIKDKPLRICFVLCCAILLWLSYVKSSYLFFVVSLFSYIFFLRFRRLKRKSFYLFFILFFVIITSILFFMAILMPQSTISEHLRSMLLFLQIDTVNQFLFGLSFNASYVGGGNSLKNFSLLSSDSGLSTIILTSGIVGFLLYYMTMLGIMYKLLYSRRKESRVLFSLVVGWMSIIPIVASNFSPMVSFFLFFSVGLWCGKVGRWNNPMAKQQSLNYRGEI